MQKYLQIKDPVERAAKFARDMHAYTNCKYDNQPYDIHLKMVEDNAERFIHNFFSCVKTERENEHLQILVKSAASCHDLFEDARISYNNLKEIMGVEVAEVVFKLTDCDGRNRRHKLLQTLAKVMNNERSKYVKLCDRIANAQYSFNNKSRMFNVYKAELPILQFALKEPNQFEDMWLELETILSNTI
jgi:(p)ppGpp synthase/HD superfamily hydrolase